MRERVQAAIKELGYSPNVSARNLARAATVHIGLLYNNPSAAYLNELLVGVLEQTSRAGCQLVLEKCGARNERTAIERLLGELVGDHVEPVLFEIVQAQSMPDVMVERVKQLFHAAFVHNQPLPMVHVHVEGSGIATAQASTVEAPVNFRLKSFNLRAREDGARPWRPRSTTGPPE